MTTKIRCKCYQSTWKWSRLAGINRRRHKIFKKDGGKKWVFAQEFIYWQKHDTGFDRPESSTRPSDAITAFIFRTLLTDL